MRGREVGRALAWTSGCAVGTGSKQRVKLFKEYVLINKAPEDYASHKPELWTSVLAESR